MYPQSTQPFIQRHPWATATALFCGVWLWTNGWYTTVAVLALAVAVIAVRRTRRARRDRQAGLRARADLEHRMALAGDPRGIHGRFPPRQAGWFVDPSQPTAIRYFDGVIWTGYTACQTRTAQFTSGQ